MRIREKLIIGFVSVTLVMGIFSLYMFTHMTDAVSKKQIEINNLTSISEDALAFSEENYHTQLEIWEYAYQPTEKRLDAFYKHKKVWDQLFDDLVSKSEKMQLSSTNKEIIRDLAANRVDIEGTWERTIDVSKKISTGKIDNNSGKYPTLSYPMFDPVTVNYSNTELRETMFFGEEVFDESQFNKKVGLFVTSQREELLYKMDEMNKLNNDLRQQFLAVFLLVILLAIGIALLFTKSIADPIHKLSNVANKIAKGELNVQLPDIKTNDEIRELNDAIKGVLAAEEFLIDEAKKGRSE